MQAKLKNTWVNQFIEKLHWKKDKKNWRIHITKRDALPKILHRFISICRKILARCFTWINYVIHLYLGLENINILCICLSNHQTSILLVFDITLSSMLFVYSDSSHLAKVKNNQGNYFFLSLDFKYPSRH